MLRPIYSLMHKLHSDCRGASAAEYALILAIIGAAIAISALALGDSISSAMNRAGGEMTNCGGGC